MAVLSVRVPNDFVNNERVSVCVCSRGGGGIFKNPPLFLPNFCAFIDNTLRYVLHQLRLSYAYGQIIEQNI